MWARDVRPSLYRQQALNRCITGSSHPNIFRHLKHRITERRRARGWETAPSPLLHSEHFFFSLFFNSTSFLSPQFSPLSLPLPSFLQPPAVSTGLTGWGVFLCKSLKWLPPIVPHSPRIALFRRAPPDSSGVELGGPAPVLLQPPSCCWAQWGP